MRAAFILLALFVAGTMADGFGRNHNHRQGRRGNGFRRPGRQGRNRAFRRGRQEELLGNYGAASETTAAPEILPPPQEYGGATGPADAPVDDYIYEDYSLAATEAPLGVYGSDRGADAAADPNLAMLEKAVPGIPGEDYPIFAEVPESGFTCDGQVDGGYYADPEAQCQVFHICTADGQGGLAKYSFLCPNGTIFNQNYFICDWWFNFDCAEAEGLYSLNEEIAAEREAASGGSDEAAAGYGAPTDYAADAASDYVEYPEYPEETQPTYDSTEAPAGYGAPGANDPVLPTALPSYEEEAEVREGRRFRGRNGRSRNGRRNNRRNNRRGSRNGRRGRNGRNFRG